MATLATLGVALKTQVVLFNGQFEESSLTNREGETYWIGKLLTPVEIRCSTDPLIEPVEVDELYLLKEVVDGDKWEGTPDTGLHIPGWKADFSKGHAVGLYQATTIKAWLKDKREGDKTKRTTTLAEKIKALRERKTVGAGS